jgi:hypothetical protein
MMAVSDCTAEVAAMAGAEVIRHPQNRVKAGADYKLLIMLLIAEKLIIGPPHNNSI